jgi:hypothetical protein
MKVTNLLGVMSNTEKICILASTDAAYSRYGEKANSRRVIFDGYLTNFMSRKEYDDIRPNLYEEPVVPGEH